MNRELVIQDSILAQYNVDVLKLRVVRIVQRRAMQDKLAAETATETTIGKQPSAESKRTEDTEK